MGNSYAMTVETSHSFAGLHFLWTPLDTHKVLFQSSQLAAFKLWSLLFEAKL